MSVSFTKAPAVSVRDVCGICLGQVRRDIVAHRNPQGEFIHHFHGRCIRDWMHIQPTCPQCSYRATITPLPQPRTRRERVVRAVIQPQPAPPTPPAEVGAGGARAGIEWLLATIVAGRPVQGPAALDNATAAIAVAGVAIITGLAIRDYLRRNH